MNLKKIIVWLLSISIVCQSSMQVYPVKAIPDAPPGTFKKNSANGATNQKTHFELQWSTSTGATYYRYCLQEGSITQLCNGLNWKAPNSKFVNTSARAIPVTLKPNTYAKTTTPRFPMGIEALLSGVWHFQRKAIERSLR